MIETSIIEIIDYGLIYFDLERESTDITKLYPGFREEEILLAIGFIEETGEIAYVYSLHNEEDRRSWNLLDLNLINSLDLQHFYEELYCIYKFGTVKPSKEVMDYLYNNNRISEIFYSQMLTRIEAPQLATKDNE